MLEPFIVLSSPRGKQLCQCLRNDRYSTVSTAPTAFIFPLCKHQLPLLGPLRAIRTIEEEEVVDVLSEPYGHVQQLAMFLTNFTCSQGSLWGPA